MLTSPNQDNAQETDGHIPPKREAGAGLVLVEPDGAAKDGGNDEIGAGKGVEGGEVIGLTQLVKMLFEFRVFERLGLGNGDLSRCHDSRPLAGTLSGEWRSKAALPSLLIPTYLY